MTCRPAEPGWRSRQEANLDEEENRIEEVSDPDSIVNFKQWSRSLFVLLDSPIIEELQHLLHTFVHQLQRAEAELTKVVSNNGLSEEAESGEGAPLPPKVH